MWPFKVFQQQHGASAGNAGACLGTGAANEKVTVSINGQQASGTTGADLNWMVNLPSMTAGGPFTLTITGTNTITITDVYIGEVWLCSGSPIWVTQ